MRNEREILQLLNNSSKVVGTKQVLKSLTSDELRCVVLSEDADDFIKTKVKVKAQEHGIEVIVAPSMQWLGRAVGIAVWAAAVGILKE